MLFIELNLGLTKTSYGIHKAAEVKLRNIGVLQGLHGVFSVLSQGPGVEGPASTLEPRGSEYPNNKASGPQIHTLNGFGTLKPYSLGTWTLRGKVLQGFIEGFQLPHFRILCLSISRSLDLSCCILPSKTPEERLRVG